MAFAPLAHHKSNHADHERANELRKASPLAEQIRLNQLRLNAKKLKIRFRHQHPIHPYIVDFICLELKLIVEVDGMSHDTRLEADQRRDEYLKNLGYEVMRFTNEDVFTKCAGVITMILDRAEELIPPYIPLP